MASSIESKVDLNLYFHASIIHVISADYSCLGEKEDYISALLPIQQRTMIGKISCVFLVRSFCYTSSVQDSHLPS